MQVRGRHFVIAFLLLMGCSAKNSSEFLYGSWQEDESKKSSVTKLIIDANGSFSIENISAKAICNSKSDDPSGGKGTWEYDAEYRRILLIFEEYTVPLCKAPYVANAFVESLIGAKRVVLYPNGADDPRSALVLVKKRT